MYMYYNKIGQTSEILKDCSINNCQILYMYMIITYQAYTTYSVEELNKNRIFTAKTGNKISYDIFHMCGIP